MRRARGDPPGLLRVEGAPAERARDARRGARRVDFPGQKRGARHIRRAQGIPQASPHGRAHVPQARGAHHARARLARRHARVRQASLGREARRQARLGGRPGKAQVPSRRPQHGVVRRHHIRQDPPGLAVFGAGDGHMVAADSGLGHGPEHHGRARRRGIEDGPGQAKQSRGMHTSFVPRRAVRVAAAVQDHARARDPPVDGLDILAVGQRGHGVADGRREVGVRARTDLRHARRGRAGPFRIHRGGLQPGEDTHGLGRPEPGRVRGGQLARGGWPPKGGVEAVNGIGVDSDSLGWFKTSSSAIETGKLEHRGILIAPGSILGIISIGTSKKPWPAESRQIPQEPMLAS